MSVLSGTGAPLEFGWQHTGQSSTLYRPYVRVGATIFDEPELSLTSSFIAAPAGSSDFTIRAGTDDVVADLAAGLDILAADGAVLKLYYEGHFGEDTTRNAGGIKASLRF